MSAKTSTTRSSSAADDNSAESDASGAMKPVHKIRDGRIEVAIWMNDPDGEPWYSVTPRRNYKKNEEWKSAGSYGQDDLLVLAKLLDLAYTWILLHAPQLKARGKAA